MGMVRFAQPARVAFSLLELLIVLAVLAIAAALAVPMLRDTPETHLRAAARLVLADLAYAQVESIAHSDDPRQFTVSADGFGYWLAARSAPDAPLVNPADQQPYRVSFGIGRARTLAGLSLRTVSYHPANRSITFGPYGQLLPDSPAALRLFGAQLSLTIDIDPMTGDGQVGMVQ